MISSVKETEQELENLILYSTINKRKLLKEKTSLRSRNILLTIEYFNHKFANSVPEGFMRLRENCNYAINNEGTVINLQTRKERIATKERYKRVNLSLTYSLSIHRLVAIYFVNNSNPSVKNQVNHIDGNKHNNNYTNLEWVSAKENSLHCKSVLKKNIGPNNWNSKFTWEQVNKIRGLLSEGYTCTKIAESYNCSLVVISNIKTGKTYK